MNNIGFVGIGYMGYGIAKNILQKGNNLFVIANKNRKPIEKIVSKGAIEVSTLKEFQEKNLNVLIKCVTNTPVAKKIALKLTKILKKNTLVIDITTHNKTGSIETEKIYQSNKINYIECPVMGGPVQAEKGILGGIVGASDKNFNLAEPILKLFVKIIFILVQSEWGQKQNF